MICRICRVEEAVPCLFSVVLSRWRDGWLFSRHRARSTWEMQGGHVEPGETPEMSARRELYEEAGGVASRMAPVCGYWVKREGRPRSFGVLFLADIDHINPLPPSEMAEVRRFETLPESLTYPNIAPLLFACAADHLREKGETT